jgi:hypothetical protein
VFDVLDIGGFGDNVKGWATWHSGQWGYAFLIDDHVSVSIDPEQAKAYNFAHEVTHEMRIRVDASTGNTSDDHDPVGTFGWYKGHTGDQNYPSVMSGISAIANQNRYSFFHLIKIRRQGKGLFRMLPQ